MTKEKLKTAPPNVRFLFQHPAHLFALGFGSGLSPVAPGTAGTLFAWASFHIISLLFNATGYPYILWPLAITTSFLLGIWACQVTAQNMHSQDPGSIVWDEIVAFWFVLFIVLRLIPSYAIEVQIAAFVFFRLFDMVKKGPVRWADERFANSDYGYENALGIMLDDIVAAFLAIIVVCSTYFLFTLFSHA